MSNYTIADLEASIFTREKVRVIFRAPTTTKINTCYHFVRKVPNKCTLSVLARRIKSLNLGFEFIFVDGNGGVTPHKGQHLSTLRRSYADL